MSQSVNEDERKKEKEVKPPNEVDMSCQVSAGPSEFSEDSLSHALSNSIESERVIAALGHSW